MEAQAEVGEGEGVAIPSRPDFVIRPARPSRNQPPIAIFADGFEFHRERTDEDSAKRMALVRAGYLVWSLTWHDLEIVLGKGDNASDMLGNDIGHMAQLQQALDSRWQTGLVRSRLGEPSLVLLVRYLQNPDPVAWRRAVFTDLLRLFLPADMRSPELRRQFSETAGQLPPELGDAVTDLPERTAIAGRGNWRNTPPEFAQILLALPLSALPQSDAESPKPDEMMAAVHLNDAAQPEQQDYRREWNGVLRLFNLLQFLPNAWWTTTLGASRNAYPDLSIREPSPEPPFSEEWKEAMSLAAPELHTLMRNLAEKGVPPPEVGHELTSETGEVVAEAELAWEAKRVTILLPGQEPLPFETAEWRVFPPDATDLTPILVD